MRAFASQKGPGKGLPASGFAPERRESPKKTHLKVVDFGLSRCEELKTAATTTLRLAGTPAFMAPELLDENSFSEASDVYSFAIVMWEIWSRQIP